MLLGEGILVYHDKLFNVESWIMHSWSIVFEAGDFVTPDTRASFTPSLSTKYITLVEPIRCLSCLFTTTIGISSTCAISCSWPSFFHRSRIWLGILKLITNGFSNMAILIGSICEHQAWTFRGNCWNPPGWSLDHQLVAQLQGLHQFFCDPLHVRRHQSPSLDWLKYCTKPSATALCLCKHHSPLHFGCQCWGHCTLFLHLFNHLLHLLRSACLVLHSDDSSFGLRQIYHHP